MNEQIIQIGHPVLRQQARPLTTAEIISDETKKLIEKMQGIMRTAPGVGLAAPQIGLSLQVIVIEDRLEYMQQHFSEAELKARGRKPIPFHALFNPKITATSLEQVTFFEGCLSGAGLMGEASRFYQITVEALNEQAQPVVIEAEGWYARILQHEIDHLNGILCIDHTDPRTLTTRENYVEFWKTKQQTD